MRKNRRFFHTLLLIKTTPDTLRFTSDWIGYISLNREHESCVTDGLFSLKIAENIIHAVSPTAPS